jgi:hypothetical protein
VATKNSKRRESVDRQVAAFMHARAPATCRKSFRLDVAAEQQHRVAVPWSCRVRHFRNRPAKLDIVNTTTSAMPSPRSQAA